MEAKAKKDELADLKVQIRERGEVFDNVRGQARSLSNDLKGKSGNLESEKGTLGNLEVSLHCKS